MALIFCGSTDLLSAGNTSRYVEPLLHWLFATASQDTIDEMHHLIRKGGHMFEYGLLALLFHWALKPWMETAGAVVRGAGPAESWRLSGLALVLSAAYAATDEFHQSFVPSRGASVRDTLIDTSGAFLALLALWVWGKYQRGVAWRKASALS